MTPLRPTFEALRDEAGSFIGPPRPPKIHAQRPVQGAPSWLGSMSTGGPGVSPGRTAVTGPVTQAERVTGSVTTDRN